MIRFVLFILTSVSVLIPIVNVTLNYYVGGYVEAYMLNHLF
jgi:hypothetical protein